MKLFGHTQGQEEKHEHINYLITYLSTKCYSSKRGKMLQIESVTGYHTYIHRQNGNEYYYYYMIKT